MPDKKVAYTYAEGDLLAEPNTYFYSTYGGKDFLSSWRAQRESVLANIPAPSPAPVADDTAFMRGKIIRTAALLEYLYGAISDTGLRNSDTIDWLSKLVQKFEVFKRVHDAYDADFKAVNKEDHKTLGNYIRMAEVFDLAWQCSENLTYLNALLKILDVLCSFAHRLTESEQSRLATIILAERRYIEKLCGTRGVFL